MAPGDYASTGSGKLKLKGVKDSKVDKKKKKKSKPKDAAAGDSTAADDNDDEVFHDKSVMLKKLEDEDAQLAKEERRKMDLVDGKEVGPGAGIDHDNEEREAVKTEAEKRYEEQRRKRVRSSAFPPGLISARYF